MTAMSMMRNGTVFEQVRQQQRESDDTGTPATGAGRARARTRARRSGRSGPYDSWTVLELRKRAKELGLTGYSSLSKSDLVAELRNH